MHGPILLEQARDTRQIRTFILRAALHKHAVGPSVRWAISGRRAIRSPPNNRAPTRRYDRQPGPPERLSLPRQNGQLCVPGRPDLPARALVCSRDTGPCDGGRALMSGYLRSCMVVGMRMLRAPRFQGRGTAGPQR